MLRSFLKKRKVNPKLQKFIQKYNISADYLSVNRRSVAKGFAIGIFVGLIPMPGHMLTVLALTTLFRFNVPIAWATVWLNNPLTMPFVFYTEYKTGSALLGIHALPVPKHMSEKWFFDNLEDISIPLYFGTLLYAATISSFVYFLISLLWKNSVYKERREIKKGRNTDGEA